jgi:hypothetical protein
MQAFPPPADAASVAPARQPCLPESCPGVSATLIAIAFDNSSLQWLEINN